MRFSRHKKKDRQRRGEASGQEPIKLNNKWRRRDSNSRQLGYEPRLEPSPVTPHWLCKDTTFYRLPQNRTTIKVYFFIFLFFLRKIKYIRIVPIYFLSALFFWKNKKIVLEQRRKNHAHHDGRRGKNNINEKFNHTSGPTMKSPVPTFPNRVPLTRSYI